MQISQKLKLRFTLIIIFTLIFGSVSVFKIRNIKRYTKEYFEKHVKGHRAIRQIQISFKEFVRETEEYMSDWITEEEAVEEIEELKERVKSHLGMIGSVSDIVSDENLIKMRSSISGSYELRDKLFLLHGSSAAEIEPVMERFDAGVEEMDDILDDMVTDVETNDMELMSFIVRELYVSAVLVILTFIILAILIIMISSTVTNTIIKPLKILNDVTVGIGEGAFDVNTGIISNDEIGDLAVSFEKMANNLKKTTVSRDSLIEEVDRRKKAERIFKIQHKLAMSLSTVTELEEGLLLCLDAAIKVSDMDCGGVYMVDDETGAIDMVVEKNLPADFVESATHYDADSANVELIMKGQPVYSKHRDLGIKLEEARMKEQLKAIGVVPIVHEKRVIGCMNLASHTFNDVPAYSREIVETMVTQSGSAIARLKAEEALRESEEKFRIFMETARDLMNATDQDGNFTYVNDSMVKTLGYSKEELIGMNISRILTKESLEKDFKPNWDKFITDGRISIEAVFLTKEGKEIPCEVKSIAVYDSDGNYVGSRAIHRDITERTKAEKEKKELQSKLLQSQKMESMGILAGGIAHDFNNILTAVTSAAELLVKDSALKKSTKSDIEGILKSSMRGARLTKQLLVFSRENLAVLHQLEINKTIIESVSMLEKIIGESVIIKLNTEKEDCYINGDKGNIEQLLMNMVVNSRDAMPNGGKILISTKKCKLAKGDTKKLGDIIPGEYVQFICEDDGVGMSQEIQARIYDPFFTTKGVGKGTGLGLSVVFGIVKDHNAYIKVNSKPGKGTTFNIYFPLIKCATTEIGKEKEVTLAGNSEKLLVIEDDEDVRHVLRRILEDKNFKVVFAESVAESEALYLKDPESIDLVLCDAVLPDGHGTKAIEKLNKINRSQKSYFSADILKIKHSGKK